MFRQPPKRHLFEAAALFFAALFTGLLLLTFSSRSKSWNSEAASAKRDADRLQQSLRLQENFFDQVVNRVESELSVVVDNRVLSDYLNATPQQRQELEHSLVNELTALLEQNPLWKSLILVNNTGVETVRVDRLQVDTSRPLRDISNSSQWLKISNSRLAPGRALSCGFGCEETTQTAPGQEDLVYRLSTRLSPAEQSWHLLLNLNAGRLFSELKSFLPDNVELTIIDPGGFYLFTPDPSLLMSQFTAGRPTANIAMIHPALSSAIRHNTSGTIRMQDHLHIYRSIASAGINSSTRTCTLIATLDQSAVITSAGVLFAGITKMKRAQFTMLLICALLLAGIWFSNRRLVLNQRLFLGFENGITPILLRSGSGEILSANSAFLNLTGYVLDELKEEPRRRLSSGLDNQQDPRLSRALSSGKTFVDELSWQRADGSQLELEVCLQPIRAFSGTPPVALLETCRDITIRRAMEKEMEELTFIDELTGLWNKRYFLTRLAWQAEVAGTLGVRTENATCTIAILSLHKADGTKSPPDRGQLLTLTGIFTSSLRHIDLTARIDRGMFAILLPYTPEKKASRLLLRLTELFQTRFAHNLHIHIGVSIVDREDEGLSAWKRAEDGCLQAVAEERNLVHVPVAT